MSTAQPKSAGLELLAFYPHNKRSLVGYADFRLINNGIIVRKCAVLEDQDGQLRVKTPEHMVGDGDNKRWTPTVDFVDEARRELFSRHAAHLVAMHIRSGQ